ncbi:MAG: phospholipid carrier-dependent glycosyltransferase [Patescibacteria group bacterium]
MSIRSKTFIILAGIIFLAFFLRFYQLGNNPPSLTWDEAAWGYNAYSIGIDGRDEFGRFLPLDYLESFGDFKPPVYAYLDVLPVKIFGLNEFAVRFPSALFGVLTVIATYFLVKRIFWKSKLKEFYALMSALILAISPWHIMLSRAAFEANVATFFIVLGVFLFLTAVNSVKSQGAASFPPRGWKPIDALGLRFLLLLSLSVISFILSMYTFNTARVVAPLLILGLAIGFRKELFDRKKEVVIASLIGLIMIIPLAQFILTPQASLRFKEVNIFSDINVIKTSNQEIANDNNAFWSKLIHNRRLVYGVEYIKHYFDNLSPNFLFIRGDGNPKFSTQTVGEMFLWDLPFFIAGILFLIRKREGLWWIIPIWLIVGIIPAATARETPHALRIETVLPTFQILTAYGFYHFISGLKTYDLRLKNFLKGKLFITISFISYVLLLINFLYFYHDYLVHYKRIYSGEWQYGYKESINYVSSVYGNYDQINITTELGRPYIYYLFYTKTPPGEFKKTAKVEREVFGFVNVKGYGKYRFLKDLKDVSNKKVLYVNSAQNTPNNAKILKTFYLLNGEPTLVAYEL